MQTITRTTLRIEPNLKKQVQELAHKQNTSMQAICNHALRQYLNNTNKQTAKKLVLHAKDLGANLGTITRDDIYDEPNFSK